MPDKERVLLRFITRLPSKGIGNARMANAIILPVIFAPFLLRRVFNRELRIKRKKKGDENGKEEKMEEKKWKK